MIAEMAVSPTANRHIRRLDMRRDLAKVADLVELCFRDSLDPEGVQYLKEMRRAAQSTALLAWASSMIEEATMPPSGYIWEEDGRLVGNLSLIPIRPNGVRSYMIANVATHPDYRGRGIATALTLTALEYVRSRGAPSAWLQVRDDNPSAINIYEAAGFIERLKRTTWYGGPDLQEHSIPAEIKVGKRRADQWELQHAWLKRLYPPELEWHIPMDWILFRPDIWGVLYRFFNLDFIHHWSVERDGELKAVVSWKHSPGFTDQLWLAVPEEMDDPATLAALVRVRKSTISTQPLSINFPADQAVNVLREAGFYPHQTLIWMEKRF